MTSSCEAFLTLITHLTILQDDWASCCHGPWLTYSMNQKHQSKSYPQESCFISKNKQTKTFKQWPFSMSTENKRESCSFFSIFTIKSDFQCHQLYACWTACSLMLVKCLWSFLFIHPPIIVPLRCKLCKKCFLAILSLCPGKVPLFSLPGCPSGLPHTPLCICEQSILLWNCGLWMSQVVSKAIFYLLKCILCCQLQLRVLVNIC